MNEDTGLGRFVGSNWRRKIGSDDNAETDSRKIKGKCHHCGKKGHKKSDCFHLERNKDKMP